jgi:Fe-S oxidoreductase/nitrate reductase gamma subunit
MNPADATRTVYWNITHIWVMYALFVPTMLIGGYGFYRRIQLWRRGQPAHCFDQPLARFKMVFRQALLQQATRRERFAGLFHTLIFWGMIILTIATIVVFIDEDLSIRIMRGQFYLWFQSLVVDLFGIAAIIGVGLAAFRRLIIKPKQLVYTDEATLLLVLLFVILLTGFLLEGWRIAATNDPWAAWSPGGYVAAVASRSVMTDSWIRTAHRVGWWFHLLLVFGLLAWAPYTKMAHAFTAMLNLYTAPLTPPGAALKPLNFDQPDVALGVNSLAGFTWKDLLDFDTCTECGRCTNACPAHSVGKQLSPRDIILDLQRLSHTRKDFKEPLIGSTPSLSADSLWACTTCAACMEACPVGISQMPKIVDMRRFLTMEQAELPETMQAAIASLETRGHPFAGAQFSRLDWAKGLNVPQRSQLQECDVLLWVGCGGALVERNQKVIRSLVQLLLQAGVKFAVLGREEKCTGDVARRLGHEFLFQSLTKDNIATLNRYQIKTVITACPHCFNTFKNEYPQLGGNYNVYHHTEYLERLVNEGKLTPRARPDAKVTFHDPCYLGRHNGIYDSPRALAELSVNSRPVEMTQNRERSFCCGGGGGLSFIDESPAQRVNSARAQQALDTGADIVAVGCPFCMTMLEDGVKACQNGKSGHAARVMDVAELLWDSVNDQKNT